MKPRLDGAVRALGRPGRDLASFRLAALGFELVVLGDRPIAVAHAIDAAGGDHWLALRSAERGVEAAYLQLLADLLRRGLRATRPVVVDAAGCRWLARRIDQALGPVAHVGARRVRGGVANGVAS